MQVEWLKQQNNPRLAVVVLGWASDGNIVRHIIPCGWDAVCLYDHRGIKDILSGKVTPPVLFEPGKYPETTLIAWSFGIWAAERLMGRDGPIPALFDKAVALNGTPFPVDELLGIGSRRLAVTVRGLAGGGKDAFDRKAYGPCYGPLSAKLSPRTLEDDIRELQELTRASATPYTPTIKWSRALIGTYDEIFPPENMKRYWGNKGKEVPLYHYPFGEESITKGLF
ncbi:MAG: DUF452 family protein [Alistipes sp.]|nr:DUF452 family protein [Alistipes sp.]